MSWSIFVLFTFMEGNLCVTKIVTAGFKKISIIGLSYLRNDTNKNSSSYGKVRHIKKCIIIVSKSVLSPERQLDIFPKQRFGVGGPLKGNFR